MYILHLQKTAYVMFWKGKIITMAFLADRTNGRAYATLLRPWSVVCRRRLSSVVCNVMYCA